MFVVDTNVLVDAADTDSPFHRACRNRLTSWRAGREPWFLTWGVCYEFLGVVTHRKLSRFAWSLPAAWTFLGDVMTSRSVSLLVAGDRHAEVAAAVIEEHPTLSGSAVHDMTMVILMREHGIRRIVTRDVGFHRFKFVEVIDPLA